MLKDWIYILGSAVSTVFRMLMEYSGYYFWVLFCYYIHNGSDISLTREIMIVNAIAAILVMVAVRAINQFFLDEVGL